MAAHKPHVCLEHEINLIGAKGCSFFTLYSPDAGKLAIDHLISYEHSVRFLLITTCVLLYYDVSLELYVEIYHVVQKTLCFYPCSHA